MARGTKNRPGTPKQTTQPSEQEAIHKAVLNTAAVMDVPVEEAEDRLIEHLTEVELDQEETAEKVEETKLTVTQRCQEAKETSCSCRCRGRYHGQEHPQGWKDEAGCEPLTKEERKVAKREALKQWRRAHPDRVSAYMKGWFATSAAPTAQAVRYAHDQKINKQIAKGVTETEDGGA